ncbi:MAG: tol-pal system protein YbgF [Gammaproteobacteria bacterium]
MINVTRLAWLPALLVLGGCPTVPPEEDPVLIKLTELEDRLVRMERVVNNRSLLDLNAQVSQMRTEVNALRGDVETTQFNVDGLAQRSRDQYVDLDGRIEDLQKGSVIRPGGNAEVVAATDPRASYQQAFALLQERRYDEAQISFGRFIEQFPENALVDNAYYWLGETGYVSGDFDAAIDSFNEVVDRFPDSSKVSDALLKIGFSQYEKKEFTAARKTLTKVVDGYADTTAARLAAQRLEQMGQEGR